MTYFSYLSRFLMSDYTLQTSGKGRYNRNREAACIRKKESKRKDQPLSDRKTWPFPIFLSNDPCYDLLSSLQLCFGLGLITVKRNSIYKTSFASILLHMASSETKSPKPKTFSSTCCNALLPPSLQ